MSYQRLPDSKRNELIAEFNEGKINPDYEVIPNKNQKGKYTVRRRKVSLPADQNVQDPPDNEPAEENQPDIQPEEVPEFQDDSAYFPSYKMKKNAMFRELQMEMNKMFIEQMKMMRQQIKHENKKRQKLKDKSQMVYDLLAEIAREPPKPAPEPEPEPESEPEPAEEEKEVPRSSNYFDNTYKTDEPIKPVVPQNPPPEPEPKVYQQPYEADLDKIEGVYYKPYSRRDRLNFKNFNI